MTIRITPLGCIVTMLVVAVVGSIAKWLIYNTELGFWFLMFLGRILFGER